MPLIISAVLAAILGVAATIGALVMGWNKVLNAPPPPPPPRIITPPRDWDFWTSAIQELSEELRIERAAVAARQADLDALATRLAAEREELAATKRQIEAIQNEIQNTVITLLESEKPNLRSLARSYSAMRPPQAVKILMNMNDDMAVKILSLMKPDVAGAILGAMAQEPAPDPSQPTPAHVPREPGSVRAARLSEMLRLLKQENQSPSGP